MSKILIISGLILLSLGVSRIANAEDLLVTQKDIKLAAGYQHAYLAFSKDGNTECILKHEDKAEERVISKSTGLRISSISQGDFKPTLKNNGREIIEELGGKYDSTKIKTDLAIEQEIRKLGGQVNFINGRILSEFQSETKLNLQSTSNGEGLLISCRSIKQESVSSIISLLSRQGSLEFLRLDEELETAAEDSL